MPRQPSRQKIVITVIHQTSLKTKHKSDAGGDGTSKAIRKSNNLKIVGSHATKPAKRRHKTTDTYPSSKAYTAQVHDIDHVDRMSSVSLGISMAYCRDTD